MERRASAGRLESSSATPPVRKRQLEMRRERSLPMYQNMPCDSRDTTRARALGWA